MDIFHLDGEYHVVFDAPGASVEDVRVTPGPVDGVMVIRATSRPRPEPEGSRALRRERTMPSRAGDVVRTVPVSWDADVSRATIEASNGVLTVRVPKRENAAVSAEKSTSDSKRG